MPLSASALLEGEQALINQGFGRYTRAAFRIGARYPRYAARLLRTGIARDSVNYNASELSQVIENSVVPAFEESVVAPAAAEALESAAVIAAPELAAAVAFGGLALYVYHKMAGGKKLNGNRGPSIDFSKIRIGTGGKTHDAAQKAVNKARQSAHQQYKPQKISQPVSTGEILRGSAIHERSIKGGIKVNGHEVLGTTRAAVSTAFTLVGAFTVSPLAYPGSRMGVLSKTYAKYNVRKWNLRVITSSPTTADGQILTYFHHNKHDPVLNWTSTGFVTTVLSGTNAVIGPKWSDSHLPVALTSKVLESSFPLGDGHMDLGAGDVFVFTRSATAQSYIVMCDYEIDFTEPQILTRIDLVPFARAQWFYCGRGASGLNIIINASIMDLPSLGGGVNAGVDGTANGDDATGAAIGDIYRFVVDVDNSIFTTTSGTTLTPNNLMAHQAPDNGALALRDGSTIYCVKSSSTLYRFFPTLSAARSYTNPLRWGLTFQGALELTGWQCLVDSMQGTLLQTSI
jgi:hypothetical protein